MGTEGQTYISVRRLKSVYYLETWPSKNETVFSLKEKLVHVLQQSREAKDINLLLPTDAFNKSKAAAKLALAGNEAPSSLTNTGATTTTSLAATAKEKVAEMEAGGAHTRKSEIPPATAKYTTLEDNTTLEELDLEDGAELAMSFWIPGNIPAEGRWEPVQIQPFPSIDAVRDSEEPEVSSPATNAPSSKGKSKA